MGAALCAAFLRLGALRILLLFASGIDTLESFRVVARGQG